MNNTFMTLDESTYSDKQNQFVFFQPVFCFEKCEYDIQNKRYIFDLTHKSSEIPDDEKINKS